MQTYVLSYVQRFSDGVEDTFLWRCEAEDFGHAREQLLDAEEGVVSVTLHDIKESESERIFNAA
jgi:hypothetical protein